MEFILDLLNRIKWNRKENPKEYRIYYYDRIIKNNIELKFDNIKKIGKYFLTIVVHGKEIDLPVHRIKIVKKGSKIVWKREVGENLGVRKV